MYTLVEIKGKQYKAQHGSLLKVDRIDHQKGDVVEFDSVLMVADDTETRVGKPYVDGVKIKAVIEDHGRDKKILVYKYKKRKNYRRLRGHRQQFTLIKVQEISGPGIKSAVPEKTGPKKTAKAPPEKTVKAKPTRTTVAVKKTAGAQAKSKDRKAPAVKSGDKAAGTSPQSKEAAGPAKPSVKKPTQKAKEAQSGQPSAEPKARTKAPAKASPGKKEAAKKQTTKKAAKPKKTG